MTLVANAFTSYSAKGIREDLSDFIYNISPTATPFMSNGGTGKITNTFFEWQTDSLAAAVTNNQQLEGDSVSGSVTATTATTRIGNYAEEAYKTFGITGTEEIVNKAGRKSEMAYQLAKKSAELKRDQESSLLANKAANAGGATTARVTAGMGAWIKTNVNKDAGGTNPSYTTLPNAARTDSATTRAFTETIHKDVLQQCYTSGAEIKFLMVGAVNKQVASGFAGIATKTYQQTAAEASAIIGAADIYVGDFGTHRIVPNRFQRARDAWYLDPAFYSVDYLQPYKVIELAKLGDADQRELIVKYGLRVKNEAALGLAADLS